MKYFFTSDEHYGHTNIIKYCGRPFKSAEEMDEEIIKRHNEVVGSDDVVFHLGDFTLEKDQTKVENWIGRLNGKPVFVTGSHDNWMLGNEHNTYKEILEKKIEGQDIVMCHYAMRVWPKSHYNSWQLFGHSHGKLPEMGKQLDVGVDTHNYYPYSFEEIRSIMQTKDNNFNLIEKNDKKSKETKFNM
jgi:calcineurin-like phosphoesterase family protein